MGNTTQAMFIAFPANERPSWILQRKQHPRKHYTSGIWKSLSSLITLYLLRHHTFFLLTIIIFIIITWIIFRPYIDLKDPCDKSSFGSLSNCCAKWQGGNFVARPFMAPFFCQNHFVSRHWLRNLRLSSANIRVFFLALFVVFIY